MQTRLFGRTGIKISELVLGGGWVGGILIDPDDETKRQAMSRALEAGINWVDTAPLYGQGKSELALGWLLRECRPTPHLSTKVKLAADELADIPGAILRSIEASLRRLGRSAVDLVYLHNPIRAQAEPGELAVGLAQVLGPNGAIEGLERARDKGLTRFIGITAIGDAACLRQVVDTGRIDAAQIYYNVLNPSAGRAMPPAWTGQDFQNLLAACARHKVGTMAIRVLAAGVLATQVRHGREGLLTSNTTLPEEERKARALISALGNQYGTPAEAAIRFALSNRELSAAVIGLAKLEHLDIALKAAQAGALPTAALGAIETLYASDFGKAR
jgi:D-threo-aldose 1-dehydrogenase